MAPQKLQPAKRNAAATLLRGRVGQQGKGRGRKLSCARGGPRRIAEDRAGSARGPRKRTRLLAQTAAIIYITERDADPHPHGAISRIASVLSPLPNGEKLHDVLRHRAAVYRTNGLLIDGQRALLLDLVQRARHVAQFRIPQFFALRARAPQLAQPCAEVLRVVAVQLCA
eukprot:IDg6224t1